MGMSLFRLWVIRYIEPNANKRANGWNFLIVEKVSDISFSNPFLSSEHFKTLLGKSLLSQRTPIWESQRLGPRIRSSYCLLILNLERLNLKQNTGLLRLGKSRLFLRVSRCFMPLILNPRKSKILWKQCLEFARVLWYILVYDRGPSLTGPFLSLFHKSPVFS